MVTRRGRGKTLCARGARLALLGGPSTSPLEGAVRESVGWCAGACARIGSEDPSLPRRNYRRGVRRVAPLSKREHSALGALLCRTFRLTSELRAGAR